MPKRQFWWMVGFAVLLCMACMAVDAAIDYESVTIKEILDGNSTFMGKAVAIEGTIAKECQGRGCWFLLDDGNASIFVDLKANNFTIPLNVTGSKAKVYGNVSALEDKKLVLKLDIGDPYVIAKKVELTGEFNSPLIFKG